jgi:hypothetical protein
MERVESTYARQKRKAALVAAATLKPVGDADIRLGIRKVLGVARD